MNCLYIAVTDDPSTQKNRASQCLKLTKGAECSYQGPIDYTAKQTSPRLWFLLNCRLLGPKRERPSGQAGHKRLGCCAQASLRAELTYMYRNVLSMVLSKTIMAILTARIKAVLRTASTKDMCTNSERNPQQEPTNVQNLPSNPTNPPKKPATLCDLRVQAMQAEGVICRHNVVVASAK